MLKNKLNMITIAFSTIRIVVVIIITSSDGGGVVF